MTKCRYDQRQSSRRTRGFMGMNWGLAVCASSPGSMGYPRMRKVEKDHVIVQLMFGYSNRDRLPQFRYSIPQ